MPSNLDPLLVQRSRQPTLLSKLWVGTLFCTVPAMALWWIPKYFVGGSQQTLLGYLSTQMQRYIAGNISIEQLRVMRPVHPLEEDLETPAFKSEGAKYPNFNKEFKVNGAKARWLTEVDGRTPNDPVVLYLHGGGYCMTTDPPQVSWCLKVAANFERVSVLEVDYTVTPLAKYPTQLNQAVATYLELQKSCNRIITLGDSAGGHLTVTLQKYLDEKAIAKPLGVVLVSPWTELWERWNGSYKENLERDFLCLGEEFPLAFCTRQEMDLPHVNPLRGDASFWQGVFGPRTVNVWGEHEVLKDACRKFGQVAGITEHFEEPHGQHDIMLFGVDNATTDFVVQHIASWLGQKPKSRG